MIVNKTSRAILPIAVVLLALGAIGPLAGPEDEKKAEKTPTQTKKVAKESTALPPSQKSVYSQAVGKTDPEAIIFTNESLDKVAPVPGRAAASAPPVTDGQTAMTPAEDPLVWMQRKKERAIERRAMIQTIEREVASARAKLDNLTKQLVATTNPFAPRPKLSEEERELRATANESALERRNRTQALVDAARKELAAAEARLVRVTSQP